MVYIWIIVPLIMLEKCFFTWMNFGPWCFVRLPLWFPIASSSDPRRMGVRQKCWHGSRRRASSKTSKRGSMRVPWSTEWAAYFWWTGSFSGMGKPPTKVYSEGLFLVVC